MQTHSSTALNTIDSLLTSIREKDALIYELSYDPGFGVPTAPMVHREMRLLEAVDTRVDVFVGDADNLKQMNSATGHQPRTDELYRPALQIRAHDALIYGKLDGGDQFLYVFPAGQGRAAIERIERELSAAPMTDAERRRYVRGVCIKRWGPFIGKLRSALGMHRIKPHPSISFVGYENIPACELSIVAAVADRALFVTKGRA